LIGGLVERPRLVDAAMGTGPISLICAPAGYGKTMLVAGWAARAEQQGQSVAWLSIDDQDDEPFQFWSAVISALAATPSGRESGSFDSLTPPHHGIEPRFLALLSEAIESTPNLRWLVLDDVQKINESTVTAGIELLLAELPDDFGVVLVCRFDPALNLHRLRLSGGLREIRAADLAFTDEEATAMLVLLGVDVEPDDLHRLVTRTEGWAAGLRLAAVSLAETSDASAFVSSFEGNDRAVADYLFAEIMQHLEPELANFLIDTCVPEQLSASLARELSGVTNAGELLEGLSRANALVVQSADPSWYRYHSLLRGYLAAAARRRDADGIARQHVTSAAWFDAHGQLSLALTHMAQSEDDKQLLDMIERRGLRLILLGHAGLVKTIIDAASDTVRNSAGAAVIAALAALDLEDPVAADGHLAIVDQAVDSFDERLTALRDSARVQRALLGGDVAKAVADTRLLDRALTGERDLDLIMLAYRGPARVRLGDNVTAIEDLIQALSLARGAGYGEFVLYTLSHLSGTTGGLCDFVAMKDWSQQAIDYAEPRGWASSPRLAYAYVLAAWTGFQTGDLVGQSINAQLALACLNTVTNVEVEFAVRSMHAAAIFESSTGSERHRAASDFHTLWNDERASQVAATLVGFATPQEVRLALAVGELRWATEAVERAERRLPGTAEARTIRAQLLVHRGRYAEAAQLLRPVLRREVVVHVETTMVTANLLFALAQADAGNASLAYDALNDAIGWAAPRNFQRPFMDTWTAVVPLLAENNGRFGHGNDFVDALFHRANEPSSVAPTAGTSMLLLTPRELELLRDLPSQMTIAEIATARAISVNTAKTHVQAAYRKLGVPNRHAAVREARLLGIL
jgi:LuxR family maltose regulon positive regulatory protein